MFFKCADSITFLIENEFSFLCLKGDSMEEMTVTFASFSALDETAACLYGTDANDLRYAV